MPGFRITNIQSNIELKDYKKANLEKNSLHFGDWNVSRATLNSFTEDKLFLEDSNYIIIIEGVILNSGDLQAKYKSNSLYSAIIVMIKEEGEKWFASLDGPISGAVYYKIDSKWVVFTGYLGYKSVFYCQHDDKIVFASQLNYITDLLKETKREYVPDEEAICRLIAYDSFIGNETCIKSIKRLYPGEYLVYESGEIRIFSYGLLDIQQDTGSNIKTNKEYIDLLDESFTKAMYKIINKCRQYKYPILLDLSGGYDSRLNAFVAHKLLTDCDEAIGICYAQSEPI